MTRSPRISGAIAAAALVLVAGAPAVQAQLGPTHIKCLQADAKAGGKLVAKAVKARQKCLDKSLKNADPGDDCSTVAECVGGANSGLACTVDSECPDGSCVTGEPAITIAKLIIKSDAAIDKKCSFLTPPEFGPTQMQFPGKCFDPDPSDAFTSEDLKYCIRTTHPNVAEDLIDLEYGSTTGPLDKEPFKCLQTIAKNGAKFANTKLKAIQKCHDALLKGKLFGFPAADCDTADSKTKAKIDKAESKTRAKIFGKCSDPNIAALTVCSGVCIGGANSSRACTTPSECPGGTCGPATTEAEAEDCIIDTHGKAVDDPYDPTVATLIDYEYAAKQPLCGDNVRNAYEEECDGPDDADCPGQCGAAGGLMGCLCLNIPRERIWEHANADLDNGWTGDSHDSGVVEGGGYVADLYDCDGPGSGDVLCTVGPSCEGGAHAACSKDSDCGVNAPCRKRRTAVGPHCALDVQASCSTNGDCPGGLSIGNVCVKTAHGAPLPISGGGVSVCVVNIFREDVVGTRNLDTGAGAVFMRQSSVTHLGPTQQQPCPVCGGFCADPVGGARNLCSSDDDCKAGAQRPADVACTLSGICSFGPNVDKSCRPDPPYGGGTDYFGNTSVDCPPDPGQNISGTGLDIIWNPVGTGTTSATPTYTCNAPGFGGKECVGGPNAGKTCTASSQCTPGTCNGLCYCPQTGGGTAQRPNRCDSACVGGDNDGELCAFDTDCPNGGFCHLADCRLNPLDPNGPTEGICASGPVKGVCANHPFKTCNVDGDCAGFNCPFCDPGETCVLGNSQCFPSGGYERVGTPDPTTPIVGAVYCIQATTSAAINNTAGLPGPGAIKQWEDPYLYGFTP
jgi:hypothetical protein